MHWDAIGIVLGTLGLLIGQAVDVTAPSGWGTLMQGGALLVLSIAFLHTLVKTLPAKDADHNAAIKAIIARQTEAADKLDKRRNEVIDNLAQRQSESLDRLAEAINRLRVHCARMQAGEAGQGEFD